MPRDGSGVYTKPAGTTAQPNTTIESAKYNSTIDDLVADANTARPIVAGGSGATTAVAAGDAYSTKGADIASSATTDIGAATGRFVHITGTTTITSFGTKTAGVLRVLTFDGALTITHNATSLILPGGANILTAAGDMAVFVSEGSGNWRCATYSRASGASTRADPKHLYGLTLSNNATDATNDIDIAAGEAASDATNPLLLTLSSAITKRLDAAWAVGSGNGGRMSAAAIADTTYHVWLIQRSDTGVVDVGFDVSATAPTMPTNYDRKRRIGTIIRQTGAILLFTQANKTFLLFTTILARNSPSPFSSSILAFGVPQGIQVEPLIATRIDWNASSVGFYSVGSASGAGANTTVHMAGGISAGNSHITVGGGFLSNTSGQLFAALSVSAGTLSTSTIGSNGWIDTFL